MTAFDTQAAAACSGGGFGRVYDGAMACGVNFVMPPGGAGNNIRNIGVDTMTLGVTPIVGAGGNMPANSLVGADPYLAQASELATTAVFAVGLLATLAATRRKKRQ